MWRLALDAEITQTFATSDDEGAYHCEQYLGQSFEVKARNEGVCERRCGLATRKG